MKIFLTLILFFVGVTFAQEDTILVKIDSTFIKTLETDYKNAAKSYDELQKQGEQLKGILLYIEEKYKSEKARLDSLHSKQR